MDLPLCLLQKADLLTAFVQGTSGAGAAAYGGSAGYGQQGYGTTPAADTSSNFGGNLGTGSSYGNDTSGYGSSAYGQVRCPTLIFPSPVFVFRPCSCIDSAGPGRNS